MSEQKIHAIDESLDKLETIISIFESKLESLPEELFDAQPPEPQAVAQEETPLLQGLQAAKPA